MSSAGKDRGVDAAGPGNDDPSDSRTEDDGMMADITPSPEAIAPEHIAGAREVQAASAALERYFRANGEAQPLTLELARFAAAMQELRDAREAFGQLLWIRRHR